MKKRRISPLLALVGTLSLWAAWQAALLAVEQLRPPRPTRPPDALVPDVNRSPARHLLLLPGVGPVRAGAIVSERDGSGPFEGLEDLQRVRGIGPKIVEGLRGFATADDP
ncbi:MAG: ComEA family DNA-binding protein [Planctomycetota bacterium]